MKYLCTKPWMHLTQHTNGVFSPCCKIEESLRSNGEKAKTLKEAWDSETLEELRQSFLRGEKPSLCSQCWNSEATSGHSDRTHSNQRVRNERGQDGFDKIFTSLPELKSLDLKISNQCNLKCRICSLGYSSQIFNEYIEMNPEDATPFLDLNSFLKSNKWDFSDSDKSTLIAILSSLEYLEIYGGEPFLQSDIIKILNLCVEEKISHKIHLRFHTNGSVPLQKFLPLITSFKEISAVFSIDDMGARFEYQRKGAKWDQVEKNITDVLSYKEKNKANHLFVEIFSTVSIYNGFYQKELLDWALEKNIKVVLSILYSPPYLNLQCLPLEIKKALLLTLSTIGEHPALIVKDDIKSIIEHFRMDNGERFDHFVIYTKMLDHSRSESFELVYPEIYSLFKPHFELIKEDLGMYQHFSKTILTHNGNWFKSQFENS